ncbi:hypothetical protein DMENIID0001_149550 [Sergentomyia squamirostris]
MIRASVRHTSLIGDVQLLAVRNPRSPVCMIICALQEIGFQFPREAGVRLRDRPAKVEIDWSLHEELKGYDKEYWSLMAPSMAAERVANVGDGAHLIYTDGSKGGNGVGAAYWDSTFDFSEEKSLRPENSIFTAELVAIRMALQRSRTTVANGRNVCVMSDSLSSLQALQSSIKEVEVPTIIADILTEIDLLYQTGSLAVHVVCDSCQNGFMSLVMKN